jgi:hypothetical protein
MGSSACSISLQTWWNSSLARQNSACDSGKRFVRYAEVRILRAATIASTFAKAMVMIASIVIHAMVAHSSRNASRMSDSRSGSGAKRVGRRAGFGHLLTMMRAGADVCCTQVGRAVNDRRGRQCLERGVFADGRPRAGLLAAFPTYARSNRHVGGTLLTWALPRGVADVISIPS